MTSEEMIESKVEEIKEILGDYDVMAHDAETVIDFIEYMGKLLSESYKIGRQLEAYIRDQLGEEGYVKFNRMIRGLEEPSERLKDEC